MRQAARSEDDIDYLVRSPMLDALRLVHQRLRAHRTDIANDSLLPDPRLRGLDCATDLIASVIIEQVYQVRPGSLGRKKKRPIVEPDSAA